MTLWRWRIFGITWLAYTGFYLTRKSFAIAKIDLARPDGMGFTDGQFATIDLLYLVSYAAGQFVWGICGDRVGTRRVVLTGLILSVLSAVAMGASSLVVFLGIFFCIQGIAQSTGWGPLVKNMGNFFTRKERGRVLGFWCTNYALGGVLAALLAGWAADAHGWRFAFWIPAGVLLLIAALFFLFQANRPEDVGLESLEADASPEEKPGKGSWKVIGKTIRNPMVLLLGAVYFLIKPIRYLVMFWAPLYINQRLGSGAAEAGILGSMFDIAGPVSVILGGYLSDKVFGTRRIPLCVIALVLVSGVTFFFDDLPATRLALGLGFFAIGFLLYIPDSLVSAAAAVDFGTRAGASTASGIINGCGSVGAIIGGTMPGWIGGGNPWGTIFPILAGALLLAGILLLPRWNALPRED